MNDNIVTLNDENGNEVQFEFLDFIEYHNEEYIVLLPVDNEDDGEVVILKVESLDDDFENYTSVEDEDVLMAVFEIFKNKFKDELDFEE
ncbi:MAG: DUF1292 domain-containing protein [Lachnospiraceae bacterium]|nr:DUF1292 domain-containing protein [Lachnospiraceae bacterium]